MPLYEYKCRICGFILEVIQKVNEPSLKECPKCKGRLEKVLSPPAIQFKGSGFYITDYAKNKKPEKEGKTEDKPSSKKADATKNKKSSHPTPSD